MNDAIQILAFAAASVLHGLTGMGFPMIGTSVLAFFMPLSQAVAVVALPSLIMSLLVLISGNQHGLWAELKAYFHQYKLLAISSVLGGFVGVWLLGVLSAAYLYLMMATVTLYYAIHGSLTLMGKAKPLTVPTGKTSMALFGLTAGLVGGATNAMSPILLIFLFSQTDDKNTIAKASNLCYLLGKLVQIALLYKQYASFSAGDYGLLATITAVSMAGLYLGVWLRRKVSATVFRGLIFGILLLLALKIGQTGLALI